VIEDVDAGLEETQLDHGSSDRYAKPARHVVEARSCQPHGLGSGAFPQGPHLERRSKLTQGLEHLTHVRPREAVVPVPAMRLDGEQPAVEQLPEVAAHRGRSYARF
jgi:hypothetical protein